MFNFKLYALVLSAIVIFRAVMNFGKPEMGLYFLFTAADLIALLGVITFSFRKPILGAGFWRIFLLLYAADVVFIFIQSIQTGFWSFLISIIFFSPALFILYLYGFKTNWDPVKQPTQKASKE